MFKKNMIKYFDDVYAVEDIEQQYQKLALKHHPDKDIMKAIIKEYDKVFKKLRYFHRVAPGKNQFYMSKEPLFVSEKPTSKTKVKK